MGQDRRVVLILWRLFFADSRLPLASGQGAGGLLQMPGRVFVRTQVRAGRYCIRSTCARAILEQGVMYGLCGRLCERLVLRQVAPCVREHAWQPLSMPAIRYRPVG